MKLLAAIQMIVSAITEPKQRIAIQEIPQGLVIDIGGGGEGVIAQAGGARIVAVDRYVSEIQEARGNAPDALWMAADVTALPCPGHAFDNATAFFSCMYMPEAVKERAFSEARRVLKPGGELWIWDAHMLPKGDVFSIRLQVDLCGKGTINTMYGVKSKSQSAASIAALLQKAGFEATVVANQARWFLIKARRV